MNYSTIKLDLENRTCPVHNIRPLVRLENGQIRLRCCCDYFTRKCISELDQKLHGNGMMNSIIDAWQLDSAKHNRQLA